MQYVIFRFLLAIRGFVRVITSILIFLALLGAVATPTNEEKVFFVILFGVIPFFIKVYYDKLLFKIKPEGTDLYLS